MKINDVLPEMWESAKIVISFKYLTLSLKVLNLVMFLSILILGIRQGKVQLGIWGRDPGDQNPPYENMY